MRRSFRGIYLLFLIFISFFTINTKALSIDPTRVGSFDIDYSYSDLKFANAKIELFRVALVTENFEYSYINEYVNASQQDLTGLHDVDELNKVAKNLSEFIDENNILATNVLETNQFGNAKISNLSTGVYLIRTESKTINNNKYYSNAILVSMPFFFYYYKDVLYDVKIKIKTEKKDLSEPVDPEPVDPDDNGNVSGSDKPNEGNNGNINIPNTYDKIFMYFGMFIISLLVIMIVIFLIYKEHKKKIVYKR